MHTQSTYEKLEAGQLLKGGLGVHSGGQDLLGDPRKTYQSLAAQTLCCVTSVEMSLDTWKATPQAYDMSTFLESASPRDAVGLALSMWEQLHDVLSLLAMHALRSSPTCVTRKRQNMVDFVAEERCHRWAGEKLSRA